VLALRGAVLAVGRATKWMVAKPEQRCLIVVGDDPYVTAATSVAAVGTALRDVRLTAKTDATSPAVARFRVQLSRIDEGGHSSILGPPLES
jgi:hypothetical protein